MKNDDGMFNICSGDIPLMTNANANPNDKSQP